ncbi:MAG: radical SAM protein [Clostridiales bacterium]|jgi:anaerobic ribonucleoside-triphosphate reductase activating protein|nr:radical SAM protein [Clostridiales bacterium]
MIRLYMTHEGTEALGPGIRYAVWTQGCLKRCPGCISPKSRDLDGGYEMDELLLAQEILESEASGITISGGEPFLQAEALCVLIREVRKVRDLGVCLYTGNLMEEISGEWETQLLGLVDVLIDGPYMEELNDGAGLRGSSNQRVFDLTGRYASEMHMYGAQGRKTEIYLSVDGSATIVGIPPVGMQGKVWQVE